MRLFLRWDNPSVNLIGRHLPYEGRQGVVGAAPYGEKRKCVPGDCHIASLLAMTEEGRGCVGNYELSIMH